MYVVCVLLTNVHIHHKESQGSPLGGIWSEEPHGIDFTSGQEEGHKYGTQGAALSSHALRSAACALRVRLPASGPKAPAHRGRGSEPCYFGSLNPEAFCCVRPVIRARGYLGLAVYSSTHAAGSCILLPSGTFITCSPPRHHKPKAMPSGLTPPKNAANPNILILMSKDLF